jgi:hypothetical protein
VLGAAIVLTAIYVVAHALLISRFPWFVDETTFASYTQTVQGDRAARFVALHDHKGLSVTWIGAVFVQLGISPMVALRLIAASSGYAAAAGTGFLVWRWIGSARAALATAALVAFVPYVFVESSVGTYDAFITGGSVVVLALQLELARRPRLDFALLLGILLGVLILAKPTGAIPFWLTPFSLIVFDWQAPARWTRLARWGGFVLVMVVITLIITAIPRLSPLYYTPVPNNFRTLSDFFHDPFEDIGFIGPAVWHTMDGYLTLPAILLGLWGVRRTLATYDRLGLVLCVWTAGTLAAYLLLTGSAFPRYGLQMVPFACALMVIGARDLIGRAQLHLRAGWIAAAAVLLAIPAVHLDATVLAHPKTAHYPGLDETQYVTSDANREPVREAAQTILRITHGALPPSTRPARPEVVGFARYPWAAQLVLSGTHLRTPPLYPYMEAPTDPRATAQQRQVNAARFLITEGPPPAWVDLRGATVAGRWPRAHGGPAVVLYDRGPRF